MKVFILTDKKITQKSLLVFNLSSSQAYIIELDISGSFN